MRLTSTLRILLASLVVLICAHAPASAQDEANDKSRLIRYVENQLSTPNRQIRLNGIEGTLSSNVSLDSITIADRDGVWLTIRHPTLVWQRSALLTGRLEIKSLTADSIDWPRMPVPDERLPAPEASGFSLPQLPVSVNIEELSVQEAKFGQPVFGLASTLSLDGSFSLDGGNLQTNLQINRLDGPGGQLALDANYQNGDPATLQLDFSLQEPKDGVLANLLNIPGTPPVALKINGNGPVDNLDVDLAFDADGERIAKGKLSLGNTLFSDSIRAKLDLSGPIQKILPEQHRAFFGETTALTADVTVKKAGGVDISSVELDSGALDLKASGSLLPDGFPATFTADISLSPTGGGKVRLPLPGDPVTAGGGKVSLRYRTADVDGWSISGRLDNFSKTGLEIGAVTIDGSGNVENPRDPERRFVSFGVTGIASSIKPSDPGIAEAIGDRIEFVLDGDWNAGQPVRVAKADLSTRTAKVNAQGKVKDLTFTGDAKITASDLASFSLLADRPLSGQTSLAVNGDIGLANGAFDLTFDGSLTDARIGNDIANRLLKGETTLSGGAARSADGLRFRGLDLKNPQLSATIDGKYASDEADLKAKATIDDFSLVDPRSSGRLSLTASIAKAKDTGPQVPYDVNADLALQRGSLLSRDVPNARLTFDGQIDGSQIHGNVLGSGTMDGETLDISGKLDRSEDVLSLSDFLARVGLSQVEADVRVNSGLVQGELAISSKDISALAALALVDAAGAVDGNVALSSTDGRQNAKLDLTVSKFRYNDTRVGDAAIKATVTDLKGKPHVAADINARSVEAAGVKAKTLTATAVPDGDTTRFEAQATLEIGTDISTKGSYRATDTGFDAVVDALSVRSRYGDARLLAPAEISRAGNTTTIRDFRADVAGGTVAISGKIAEEMNLRAEISKLPLSIANSIRPDLALAGTLDGTVTATGASDDPRAKFSVSVNGFEADALSKAGIAPIDADASGTYEGNVVDLSSLSARNRQGLKVSASGRVPLSTDAGQEMDLRAEISKLPLSIANSIRPDLGLAGVLSGTVDASGTSDDPRARFSVSVNGFEADALNKAGIAPIDADASGTYAANVVGLSSLVARNRQGLEVSASGRVPLSSDAGQALNLQAEISNLPLSVVNGIRPELGLAGVLSGTVDASGTTENPRARFTLSVSGLDANALRGAGIAPINTTASGTYEAKVISLSSLSAQNSQNLNITASGRVPLSGSGLSVNVNGSAPLSAAEQLLAARGTSLTGTLRLDATISGSFGSPSFGGLFSLSNASISDPLTNIRLTGINGMAGLRGDTISITRLSGQLGTGGSVSIGGTIGLSGALPANLTVKLSQAVYTDARTFKTTASGIITVTGALRAGPLVAGTVNLADTEITIPETLAGDADLLPVKHLNPDRETVSTLERIRQVTPAGEDGGPSAPVRLDINVISPNRIFVRGRGIDAEFGGSVTVRGPLDALRPVGAFNLIRGRLSILNKRLELTQGRVTLTGSLDPLIDIAAQVSGNDIVATIALTGRASDLQLTLSSSPDLPQDEILARIVFGKSLTELSPLQIANLAVGAASLVNGGGGNSLTEQLRQGIGVDDLDIVQGKDGNVALKAGKYIRDNVYLDIQAGSQGGEASINLDITDSLKTKGTVDTEGNSSLGVFFEKDY